MWTNESETWNLIYLLKEKGMMTSKMWGSLRQRTSTAKFYYFIGRSHPSFDNKVHTTQYVRNWMWVYELFRTGKSNPNANYMNEKYRIGTMDVAHPEECKWVEVTGLNLDDLNLLSSKCDTFLYQSDVKPKVLRELPMTTFSLQLAELLH
jgi:hypothetical protein